MHKNTAILLSVRQQLSGGVVGSRVLMLVCDPESDEISDCCSPHTSIRSSTTCSSTLPLVRLHSNMNMCEVHGVRESACSLALLLCCWLQGRLEALSGPFDFAMRNRVSMRRDNKGQRGSGCMSAFSHLLLSVCAVLPGLGWHVAVCSFGARCA